MSSYKDKFENHFKNGHFRTVSHLRKTGWIDTTYENKPILIKDASIVSLLNNGFAIEQIPKQYYLFY